MIAFDRCVADADFKAAPCKMITQTIRGHVTRSTFYIFIYLKRLLDVQTFNAKVVLTDARAFCISVSVTMS